MMTSQEIDAVKLMAELPLYYTVAQYGSVEAAYAAQAKDLHIIQQHVARAIAQALGNVYTPPPCAERSRR